MMESHLMFFLILFSSLHSIQCPVDLLTALHLLPPTPTSSMDFGRTTFNSPYAVLSPKSPTDISLLLTTLSSSPSHGLTVAARGAVHSVHGQAQALDGIVVEMDALRTTIEIRRDGETGFAYADASGGTLWVELLEESLKEGLTPRSWTDYLYLTIGGTLSNGGISGQTFKYGPQISNVLQLEVITGTGETVTCSATHDQELFHAVLGGLGQFGIITSARIILQDAPQKVRWVRAFYEDFGTFIADKELLVSMPQLLDYVEGFMVLNELSLHSSFMDLIPIHHTEGNRIYYCLEFAVHVYQDQDSHVDNVVEEIETRLRCMQHYIYRAEVSYYDFLNRVRMEEMSLRGKGLWDIPHPWLNMFVPKTSIMKFKVLLLENISPEDFVGHILIYPILRNK